MNNVTKVLLFTAFAFTMSGAAMGQGTGHICAYVNDNVNGPNVVEGYKIGPGNGTAHVGPYSTNGNGNGGAFYAGGEGAARAAGSDLYVDDAASHNITHFFVNKMDCTLTLDTTLYPSGVIGVYGFSLAVTPDGGTMFVGATGPNYIHSLTIAANGSLGPPVKESLGLGYVNGLAVSPDGQTLIVNYVNFREVCAYPISAGHLGTPNCQATPGYLAGVSIDPASACVYVAETSSGAPEVAALALNGGVLGPATDYNPFGPGENSSGILVNWENNAIYVTDTYSAQLSTGLIAAGCKLTYKSIMSDGLSQQGNQPGQIAQDKTVQGYLVSGDSSGLGTPSMGIFRVSANGKLTPLGSGQFPLMSDTAGSVGPSTVVVVGSE